MLTVEILKVATHEGTGRRDRSHRVNRQIFVKNPVAGTEFWSPKSVPRIQIGLNSWGPVAGTSPRNILLGPSCEQGRGTGPCDQLKMNQSLISILSSHNSARSCLKMAMPEQSGEQIEQNTTEQTVGINVEDWSVTSTRMVIDSSFIRNRHHHQKQQSLFLRSSRSHFYSMKTKFPPNFLASCR